MTIPVAVKVGPYFSSFAHMAGQLDEAGADALVLFNRFYQPDFDIETRAVVPSLSLSKPDEIRLPLLWIALLHGRVKASLAATTGVHSAVEAIKYLMAGADVVMSTSALLQQGPAFFAPPGRHDGVDGEEGLRIGRPDARLHEPASDAGLHRVRAGQLHQGPRELHEDDDQRRQAADPEAFLRTGRCLARRTVQARVTGVGRCSPTPGKGLEREVASTLGSKGDSMRNICVVIAMAGVLALVTSGRAGELSLSANTRQGASPAGQHEHQPTPAGTKAPDKMQNASADARRDEGCRRDARSTGRTDERCLRRCEGHRDSGRRVRAGPAAQVDA